MKKDETDLQPLENNKENSPKNKLKSKKEKGSVQMKKWKTGKKLLVGALSITTLATGGLLAQGEYKLKVADAQELQLEDKIEEIKKNLYESKDSNMNTFLDTEMKLGDISSQNKKIKTFIENKIAERESNDKPLINYTDRFETSDKDFKEDLDHLKALSQDLDLKISLYESMNKVFSVKDAFQKQSSTEKWGINKDLTDNDISKVKTDLVRLSQQKNKDINNDKLILRAESVLELATKELKKNNEAKATRDKLIKDNKIISTDVDQITKLEDMVASVENEDLKKELTENVKTVKEQYEKNKAEAKAIEEERVAQEQAQKEQAQVVQQQSSQPSQQAETVIQEQPQAQATTDTKIGDLYTTVEGTSAMGGFSDANILYYWHSDMVSNWYLAEYISPVGRAVKTLGVGSVITVQGRQYTVTQIDYGIRNGTEDVPMVIDRHNAIGGIAIQTCETTSYNSTLTIVYAV